MPVVVVDDDDDDKGIGVRGEGNKQYVPPKCMVRRDRSVRHVHFEGLLRKARRVCSSSGVIKFSWRVRPGTDGDWMVDDDGDEIEFAFELVLLI